MKKSNTKTRFLVAAVATVGLLGLAGLGTAGAATQGRRAPAHVSTKSSFTIGYSQSWTGNAFRKEQDADFVAVANGWIKSGKIAGYDLLDAEQQREHAGDTDRRPDPEARESDYH